MEQREKVRCLIIGSGPAGYTAAIYAGRANLSPVLYCGLQMGGQLTQTTIVENFPGYPEGVDGNQMMMDLQQQANEVDEARLELQLRKRNLDQCEENLHISHSAYSVGMETLSDLLTAQVLWQEAYAQLIESRYTAKVKMMKWRKAAGRI